MADPSDSAILDTRFPGYAWMPRWTRRYWTPQTALGIALAIFSAGSWVGTYLTAPDVRTLTKDVGDIKALTGPRCEHGCLVTREYISLMESHVSDLWAKKTRTEQEAEKPVEFKRYNAPAQEARKGKVKR